jgi:hypothetical protein
MQSNRLKFYSRELAFARGMILINHSSAYVYLIDEFGFAPEKL